MSTVRVGTWDTLRLHPMTLMRMVIDGKATVMGKDVHGRKIYEIKDEDVNRETTGETITVVERREGEHNTRNR